MCFAFMHSGGNLSSIDGLHHCSLIGSFCNLDVLGLLFIVLGRGSFFIRFAPCFFNRKLRKL